MLETLKEKWNDILKYLKEEYDISDVSFDTWLLPLEVYALEQPGNIVKIIVPDANFLGYIKKKYSTMLMVSGQKALSHKPSRRIADLGQHAAQLLNHPACSPHTARLQHTKP